MTPNRVPGAGDSGRSLAGSSVRQARLARVNMIRRRVVAGALGLFVITWMLITLMLVSGHDPALASQRSATKTSASSATTTPSTTTPAGSSTTTATTPATGSSTTTSSTPATSSSTPGSSSSGSSSSSAANSSGVSPVTSSQS